MFTKKNYGDRKVTHKPAFKGGSKFGGTTRKHFDSHEERPAMFSATCSQCNSSCEVPFKPNGKKPVLCLDCFRKTDAGAQTTYHKPREVRDNRAYPSKPTFRSAERPQSDDVSKQLKDLNTKMDQILAILTVTKSAIHDD